jgi:hypothetical protein
VKQFQEYRFYSPQEDRECARISMTGRERWEYYAVIRADEVGSRYRKRRQKACALIAAAIDRGDEPGQVVLDEGAMDVAITAEIERERALQL